MAGATPEALASWESFYVIVGSSSAALIGLQFVVITLMPDTRMRRTHTAISAFATPTVVHFAGALIVSAIMSAPWHSLSAAASCLVVYGIGGVCYGVRVVVRARRQTTYTPVWEDWLWHVILPDVAYATLAISAMLMHHGVGHGMFGIAASALALLLIGIHNAWDTVTYLVVADRDDADSQEGE